ncbi:unnamed protein product [Arabidopsis lyrata]|uniref:O-fucosyltransferase family protein n=1 Tax=Arabidopsis lyrata subsp. lyrata TaxID=81972 RepID=D7MBY9_ARALL|nr:hypothetical protein ARALYDRAFT_914974 [Arabidopsis lyrata subsp. lyrata]CAH8276292.1 unnamed protein product [Arabidopsis lyrata]
MAEQEEANQQICDICLLRFSTCCFLRRVRLLHYLPRDTQVPPCSRSLHFLDPSNSRSEILTRTLLGQKFLWYAPHCGYSNQLSEFKNAVLMAGILNRTLIFPPILDPKFLGFEPQRDTNLCLRRKISFFVMGFSKINHCGSRILVSRWLILISGTSLHYCVQCAAVCSCASLNSVGTAGSSIADSVEMMRKYNACSSS